MVNPGLKQGSEWKCAREVEVLCNLHNPHCVDFYGCYFDDLSIMLVMELCEGGNLNEAMLQRPLFVKEHSYAFMSQIACAVEYLHSNSIIHRDINPSNVVLDKSGEHLKLCDFGISRILPDGQSTVTMTAQQGTLCYMAPEMLRADEYMKMNGEKCDVYSTAILFSELVDESLSFRATIDGKSFYEIIESIVEDNERPILPENTPSALASLIVSMWAADPKQRPNFVQVVVALEKYKAHV